MTCEKREMEMRWAYGVTTVPSRFKDLLPDTLRSLEKGGFDRPRLFIDDCRDKDIPDWMRIYEITLHYPRIRTFGNWFQGLGELFIRNPYANRFAMFQDDLLTYPSLRDFLEKSQYPEKGYLNLYTVPENDTHCPREGDGRKLREGWFLSNQLGRGAVGLVFDRDAVMTLLGHPHMIERPLDLKRGHRSIDGGIVTALAKAGVREWCHNPSLVQHQGFISTMASKPQKQSVTFRGVEFDAMKFL